MTAKKPQPSPGPNGPSKSEEVYSALYARYPKEKWVCLREAPSDNLAQRRADLIAIGVWQSSGNQIIGHEVKVSRSDWLREVQDPAKSEWCSKHCDRWYIVAPKGVVRLEELRADWGLIELGKSLRIRRQGTKLSAEPIPRNMLASWLRTLTRGPALEERNAEYWRGYEAGKTTRSSELPAMERKVTRLQADLEHLREVIERFEAETGVHIFPKYNGGIDASINVVKLVQKFSTDDLSRVCRQFARFAGNQASDIEKASSRLNSIADEFESLSSSDVMYGTEPG